MSITLGKLIEWLEEQDPDLIVKDGFSHPHSDRGCYEELAFDPEPEARLGDMLVFAKSALCFAFEGWKGGHYEMNENTPVHIGFFGNCGDPITPHHFKYWLLTGEKPVKKNFTFKVSAVEWAGVEDFIDITAESQEIAEQMAEEQAAELMNYVVELVEVELF